MGSQIFETAPRTEGSKGTDDGEGKTKATTEKMYERHKGNWGKRSKGASGGRKRTLNIKKYALLVCRSRNSLSGGAGRTTDAFEITTWPSVLWLQTP